MRATAKTFLSIHAFSKTLPSSETQGQLVGSIKCSWWKFTVNFHHEHSIDPTSCPYVSEDEALPKSKSNERNTCFYFTDRCASVSFNQSKQLILCKDALFYSIGLRAMLQNCPPFLRIQVHCTHEQFKQKIKTESVTEARSVSQPYERVSLALRAREALTLLWLSSKPILRKNRLFCSLFARSMHLFQFKFTEQCINLGSVLVCLLWTVIMLFKGKCKYIKTTW